MTEIINSVMRLYIFLNKRFLREVHFRTEKTPSKHRQPNGIDRLDTENTNEERFVKSAKKLNTLRYKRKSVS